MTNTAKGALHERRVASYLQAQGYAVDRGFKRAAFVKGRVLAITCDLLGAYDLIAVLPSTSVPRLIQVTAGGDLGSRKAKAFGTWPLAEVWEHVKAGVYRIHRRERTDVVDIRSDQLKKGDSR